MFHHLNLFAQLFDSIYSGKRTGWRAHSSKFIDFFKQLLRQPCDDDKLLEKLLKENGPASKSGRMAIVTGANAGIGFELARMLAKTGYHVVLACRNTKAGEQAIETIRRELTASSSATLETIPLDLSSLKSVDEFVSRVETRIKESGSKLDLLVNNAGVMFVPRTLTKDGYEIQFQANYLSHFALTIKLVEAMARHGGPSRVVNVTSDTYEYMTGLNFDDLAGQRSSHRFWAYANSNVARTTITKELARRFADKSLPIQAFAVHPGSVTTSITRNSGGFFEWGHSTVMGIFCKDPLHGAIGSFYAAVGKNFDGNKSGVYLSKTDVHPMTSVATDPQNGRRLWEESLRLARLQVPKILM